MKNNQFGYFSKRPYGVEGGNWNDDVDNSLVKRTNKLGVPNMNKYEDVPNKIPIVTLCFGKTNCCALDILTEMYANKWSCSNMFDLDIENVEIDAELLAWLCLPRLKIRKLCFFRCFFGLSMNLDSMMKILNAAILLDASKFKNVFVELGSLFRGDERENNMPNPYADVSGSLIEREATLADTPENKLKKSGKFDAVLSFLEKRERTLTVKSKNIPPLFLHFEMNFTYIH